MLDKLNRDKDKDKDQNGKLAADNADLLAKLKKLMDDRKKMLADLAALEKLNGDLKYIFN